MTLIIFKKKIYKTKTNPNKEGSYSYFWLSFCLFVYLFSLTLSLRDELILFKLKIVF